MLKAEMIFFLRFPTKIAAPSNNSPGRSNVTQTSKEPVANFLRNKNSRKSSPGEARKNVDLVSKLCYPVQ